MSLSPWRHRNLWFAGSGCPLMLCAPVQFPWQSSSPCLELTELSCCSLQQHPCATGARGSGERVGWECFSGRRRHIQQWQRSRCWRSTGCPCGLPLAGLGGGSAWPAAQHRGAAGSESLILGWLGLAVGASGRFSSSILGQEQVSQCLRSCLAGIGLAKRQHSAVPLVDSVFFPDNGLTTPSLITVMNSASW